jgi:pyruvate dehydrogenase E1 component alpha subunit
VEEHKERDPVALGVATLLARGWADQEEVTGWDQAAKEAAADAAEFAKDSPQPDVKDVGAYVYKAPLSWRPDDATTPHDPATRTGH